MFHRKANKRIVELSSEEVRLMREALLSFAISSLHRKTDRRRK